MELETISSGRGASDTRKSCLSALPDSSSINGAFSEESGPDRRLSINATSPTDTFSACAISLYISLEARLSGKDLKLARRATAKARGRTSDQVLTKIATRGADDRLRIVDQPPLTRHLDDPSIDVEKLFAELAEAAAASVA